MRAGRVQGRSRLWIPAVAAAVLCMLAAAQFAAAQAPGPATVTAAVAGDGSLTVAWDPPAGTSSSDITAYDLRYIETSADETVDSNWELVLSAWAEGPRHYMIDGLTNDTSYDVQVRAVTTTAGEWSPTVAQTPGDAGNTVSSAVALPLNVPVAGVIDSDSDIDVFEVTVPEQMEVLIYTTGDLEATGALLNSGGAEIASVDFAYVVTTENNFLIWDTLSSGTYYVSVSSDASTGSYTLHTESTVNTTGFDDAAPIGVGTATNAIIDGGSNPTDYFRLDVDAAADVVIYTTAELKDTVGTLYGSDEQQLAASDDGYLSDSRSFVIRRRLDAGTYYVTVEYYLSRQRGPYTLHVQEVDEPGSSLSAAASLALEGVAAGNIDPASDVDYFRIDIDETKRVEIRAASATAAISGALLDSGGDTITDAVQAVSVGDDDLTTLSVDRTLAAGTYYLRVDTSGSAGLDDPAATGAYAVSASEDPEIRRLIERCHAEGSVVQDVLYGCQWYLSNTGQVDGTAGEDLNVEAAWETTLGSGIVVAVVDSHVDGAHEDLVDNFDAANSHDYFVALGQTASLGSHGTAVAGIVAGRSNSIGIRGVAPEATIRSFNVLQAPSDFNAADAMVRHAADTAANTNSWSVNDGRLLRAPRIWELAVEHGLAEGDSGRGTFYTWAAGNGARMGIDFDDVNLDEYTNFYGVTAVCAVNNQGTRSHYSKRGAALWVCAPSSDSRTNVLTTAPNDGYDQFGGTSAAAPQAAGVAALVRAANPSLTWRDVKLIVAGSARKNDPDHDGWQTGAAKYGSDSDSYEFNHSYGFGVIDAGAAVELAQDWTNVPALRSHTVAGTGTPVTVGPQASDTFAESTATMRQEFAFIEFVEVNVVMAAPTLRHLEMDLVSPQGAVSKLLVPSAASARSFSTSLRPSQGPFRLGSARHLGENPAGEWTLRLRDRINGGRAATLESWTLTVYGHGLVPGPPDIISVDGVTDPVTVSWDPPEHSGASAVTGYDLRHIRNDASDKADANWTVASDVWSSGTLEHTVTGLSAGVDYDFGVRAVSSEGNGGWSSTVTGSIGSTVNAPRFGPDETGIRNVAENTAAGVAIGDPVAATDGDGDTLTYTATGTDASAFTLDTATGQLSTKAELDHESRSAYTFGLVAATPDGYRDTIDVTVNVADVNEPPDLGRKRILGMPSQPQRLDSAYENDIFAPWLFVGTDPDDDELRWSLSGADAAHFTLNDTDLDPRLLARYGPHLQLEFASPPDFEQPGDADGDNFYDVTVSATDGTHTTSDWSRIRVLNVNEAGAVSLSTTQPEVGTAVTAELSDGDGGVSGLSWNWQRSPDRTTWSTISGAGSASYTPVTADVDQYLQAVATYSDGHGSGKSARAETTDAVSPDPTPNANPQFPSTETGRRTVAENTPPGREIGTPVATTDPDGDSLTYTLGGVDASSFEIASTTGQIRTSTALDHEAKDSYSVTVSVRDNKDAANDPDTAIDDTVNVEIVVTDVNEAPVLAGGASTVTRQVDENSPPGTSIGSPVAANDPENDTLTYALGGPDASSFDIEASTGQILTSAALDHETNDTYSVTVSVHDSKDANGNPDTTVDDTVAVTVGVNDIHEADPATVVWSATLTVGVDSSQPPGSGYSRWARLGELSERRLTLGGTSMRMMLIVQLAEGLFLAMDRPTDTDFTLTLGDAEFTASDSLIPHTAGSGRYWWATDGDLWTEGDEVDATITASTETLSERAAAPPIAYFGQIPRRHNGTDPFKLRLNFDRELPVTAAALKDHALETVGGTVTGVAAVSDGSTLRWLITVQPDGTADVTISLPAEAACDQPGAICTADGQKLHNLPQVSVPGPSTN